jgi:hypothetical protein
MRPRITWASFVVRLLLGACSIFMSIMLFVWGINLIHVFADSSSRISGIAQLCGGSILAIGGLCAVAVGIGLICGTLERVMELKK